MFTFDLLMFLATQTLNLTQQKLIIVNLNETITINTKNTTINTHI